jgi:hypothetical protein
MQTGKNTRHATWWPFEGVDCSTLFTVISESRDQ